MESCQVLFANSLDKKCVRTHFYQVFWQKNMVTTEALTRAKRVESRKVQTLLRGRLELLSRVEHRTGSLLVA